MKMLGMVVMAIALTACGMTRAQAQPLLLQVSDSVGLISEPTVRDELAGEFRVAHACGSGAYGTCNNGSTLTILQNAPHYFDRGDPDIITFNSGIHDMTFDKGCSNPPRVPAAEYYRNVSEILAFLSEHAKVVIWIDTTSITSSVTCADQKMVDEYNHLADEAARQHGAYRLHIVSRDHAKDGIHFTYAGSKLLGQQIADCVRMAWVGKESASCVLH